MSGARIEPLLPTDARGMARLDDRRVLSRIAHAPKNGRRKTECPREVCGPKKTLYNRFVRWARRGVWEDILVALAGAQDVPEGTCIKVHRCARGGKRMGLAHGMGITKAGRNSKLHAVCDTSGRRLIPMLTP